MTAIQDDPNHQANSISDTTPEQAKANTLFAVRAQVDKVNAAKVTDYENQWSAYVVARDARPDATNLIVPIPARAEAVFVDGNGWPYVDTSDKPVIAPHVYVPAIKTPGGFFTAGGSVGASTPDPFAVAIAARVAYRGMTFMRIE